MRIHGLVYVVLGILMAVFSKFIESKLDNNSMALFFWVGLGFIAFGVFRLMTLFVFNDSSKKPKLERKNSNPELEKLKQEKAKMMSGQSRTQESEREIVVCPRCGVKHYSSSNFCHMCGCSLK